MNTLMLIVGYTVSAVVVWWLIGFISLIIIETIVSDGNGSSWKKIKLDSFMGLILTIVLIMAIGFSIKEYFNHIKYVIKNINESSKKD